jgi:methionine sulfoxide reductase heme-binding subunit
MREEKNDFAEVNVYAAILAALLGWRVWHMFRTTRSPAA